MDKKPAPPQTRKGSLGEGRGATILIVEDSPVQAELLRRALEGAGYKVIAARDGAEGLALAKANHPVAVLSDINMPVMDGYAMCQAIRREESLISTPVILLTMLSDPEDVIRGLNAGADAYLTKPYNIPSLVARIASLLANPLVPPPATERRKLQVLLAGEARIVDAHGPRMLNLLISTYENAVLQNRELTATQQALEDLNQHLEQKVLEKTAELHERVKEQHCLYLVSDLVRRSGLTNEDLLRAALEPIGTAFQYPEITCARICHFDESFATLNFRESPWVLASDIRIGDSVEGRVEVRYLEQRPTAAEGPFLAEERSLLDTVARTLAGGIGARRAAQALAESQTRFRSLIENGSDLVVVLDAGGVLTYASPSAQRIGGYRPEELVGRRFADFVHAEDLPIAADTLKRLLVDPTTLRAAELRYRRKDGSWIILATLAKNAISDPGVRGIVINARDVTETKRAEAMIRENESRLRTIFDKAQDVIYTIAEDGAFLSLSPAIETITGWTAEEWIGRPFLAIVHPDDRQRAQALLEDVCKRSQSREFEMRIATKAGAYWVGEFRVGPLGLGGRNVLFGIGRDITVRKRDEMELRRLNWALRALGQGNSALVHAGGEKELFQGCCDAIAGTGGFALAWIGLACDDAAHSIGIIASAGEASKYQEGLVVSWADEPRGRGPTGTSIRTGVTQVTNNLATSAAYLPWIERARAHGLASSISLPIRASGSVMGSLAIYSREVGAFGQPEVELFEELAADIGYGVAARRTRVAYEAGLVESERATRKLRAAFESLIAVLAATVERRDPYTAGHQRRVAELASAIGNTLGLDPARIQGLHFAATIHDIGKIYVPAEILARPGKLGATEFELVKAHAQVGFEIVKDVDFPWQVADMIRQHHERLDGSGYPQGLKGDQILLESRILAVADVVEAMSSHRPYRPGLGIDAALAEIRQEAGTKLDLQVVSACERVFREQGFAFAKA